VRISATRRDLKIKRVKSKRKNAAREYKTDKISLLSFLNKA